jgi:hypothetical protein
MKTEIKLISYTDPGHGWLRVPLKMLAKLSIADKISPFSYVRTVYAYLEEDLDAPLFLETLKNSGKTVKFVTRHTNRMSRIRNYTPFGVVTKETEFLLDNLPVVKSASESVVESVPQEAEKTVELV